MAVDTVGLGAEREKRHGYLPDLSLEPAYLSASLDCSPGPFWLCPALSGPGSYPSFYAFSLDKSTICFIRQPEKVSLTAASPGTLQIQ